MGGLPRNVVVSKIEILEGISRGFFIVTALFALIGLAWSGENRSVIGNSLYILHIVLLLSLALYSRKLMTKTIYLLLNIIGLCLASYFIITEAMYIFFLGIIGFIILLVLQIISGISPKN